MADRMTQAQLVRHLAEANGISKKSAREVLQSLVETAVSQTKRAGIFVLPGLGRMRKVQRKARLGRHPATGEPIKIPAKTTVKFYLSKTVKDSVAPKKK